LLDKIRRFSPSFVSAFAFKLALGTTFFSKPQSISAALMFSLPLRLALRVLAQHMDEWMSGVNGREREKADLETQKIHVCCFLSHPSLRDARTRQKSEHTCNSRNAYWLNQSWLNMREHDNKLLTIFVFKKLACCLLLSLRIYIFESLIIDFANGNSIPASHPRTQNERELDKLHCHNIE